MSLSIEYIASTLAIDLREREADFDKKLFTLFASVKGILDLIAVDAKITKDSIAYKVAVQNAKSISKMLEDRRKDRELYCHSEEND